jgi:aryl carrier-like protein
MKDSDAFAAVRSVWKTVLSLDAVRPEDNFFSVGGNSIIALRVVAELRDLGHKLEVADIFRFQTAEKISSELRRRASVATGPANDVANQGG